MQKVAVLLCNGKPTAQAMVSWKTPRSARVGSMLQEWVRQGMCASRYAWGWLVPCSGRVRRTGTRWRSAAPLCYLLGFHVMSVLRCRYDCVVMNQNIIRFMIFLKIVELVGPDRGQNRQEHGWGAPDEDFCTDCL